MSSYFRKKINFPYLLFNLGALHKVLHSRGEGAREGATVCDRGGRSTACDVTFLKNFIHMKPKIESDIKLSVVTDVFRQKENGQKLPRSKPSDKNPQTKTPDKTP